VRKSSASKDVNPGAQEPMAFVAVSKKRTDEDTAVVEVLVLAIVNCKECESAIHFL
jgi:hypothetical protein